MNTLRALSVIPDEPLAQQLAEQVQNLSGVCLTRSSASYPSLEAVLRAVRVDQPDFIFVYVKDLDQLESFLMALDGLAEGTPVIGLGTQMDAALTLRLMHLGVREYLTFPLDPAKLTEAVASVGNWLKKHSVSIPSAAVYSFMPAKPGVGCSTLAVAAASVLANELSVRTLLIDGDLYSGPVQFLLKLNASASLVDALGRADTLDETMWAQMVARERKLDVLHSGEHLPPQTLSPDRLARVLTLARSLYDVTCVDLPSGLDPLSQNVLEESRRIFLVTTGELAPLHFAKVHLKQLSQLGLRDRVSLILRRDRGRLAEKLTNAQVGEAVGIPVAFTFPSAYDSVQRAVLDGEPVPHDGELSRCLHDLARFMVPDHTAKTEPPPAGPKFLQDFRIPHAVPADAPLRS